MAGRLKGGHAGEAEGARRRPPALVDRARAWMPVALLAGVMLATVLRAPVYFAAPSFWAEEGTLHFAFAWGHPLAAALAYRPAGYLGLYPSLATGVVARLVRGGLVALEQAPRLTVLFALAAQLLPVALIVWSRALFWDGALRRVVGVAIVLFGALTDEIWLNTINSQSWLTVAAALVLLEPGAAAWISVPVVAVAGLSAPVACTLLPLFAWRAWRRRTAVVLADAAALAIAAAVQVACVATTAGDPLARRTAGLDLGVFAATVWARAIIVPTLGVGAAGRLLEALRGPAWTGAAGGAVLLAAAAGLLVWIARGLRAEARYLVGGFVLATTFTLFTSTGGKTLLLASPSASSRYFYAPGVLLLLALLGAVRRDVDRVHATACALLVAVGLAHGVAQYPVVRWQPGWPRWSDEVRAWRADPARPLRIWPPPWKVALRPEVKVLATASQSKRMLESAATRHGRSADDPSQTVTAARRDHGWRAARTSRRLPAAPCHLPPRCLSFYGKSE
jgi:hypothetical protein